MADISNCKLMRPTHDTFCTAGIESWRAPARVRSSTASSPRLSKLLHKRHKTFRHPVKPQKHTTAPSRLFHTPPIPIPDPFSLSLSTRRQLNLALSHGLAGSTITSYGHAVARFRAFCDHERVPTSLRWPADEFVLCAFAASHCGRVGGSAVRSYVSGLKAWHTVHNAPWLGSAHLAYVLNGVENLTPTTSKRPPRPPITRAMLRALHDNLDLTNSFDIAVFSAACSAFWGQCRLGELLCPSVKTFDPELHPTAGNLFFTRDAVTIHLPWTKTKKGRGDDVVLASQLTPLNPMATLRLQERVNHPPPHSHLFAYHHKGTLRPLTRNAFLKRCNIVWMALGYPRSTGHSFRIGGTTELLLAGVHPDVVKVMGRWSSDAFLIYWRALGELAPLHASDLPIHRVAA